MLYTDVKSVVVSRCDQLSPGCRAVELSRLRRGAVEPVVEALPVEPVEPVEADSMRRPVELSRSCRAVEKLSSCQAVEVSSVFRAVELSSPVAYSFAYDLSGVLGVISTGFTAFLCLTFCLSMLL
jgi:hypothetical protein